MAHHLTDAHSDLPRVPSRRSAMGGVAGGLGAMPGLMRKAFALSSEVVPFRYTASDKALADLKERVRNRRLPEGEIVSDWSQGVPSPKLRDLIAYARCDAVW